MYSTAYILWTFTWFVHFKLPFRLKGTDKIHIEGLSKFHSNIYFILFDINRYELTMTETEVTCLLPFKLSTSIDGKIVASVIIQDIQTTLYPHWVGWHYSKLYSLHDLYNIIQLFTRHLDSTNSTDSALTIP